MNTLTQEQLKEVLSFDHETGVFTWKTERIGRKQNAVAGTTRKDNYRTICINKKYYLAHRLAWLYFYGEWPKKMIDHIDRNKSNNQIKNLRDVSQSVNQCNVDKAQKNNKSTKLLGAYFNKKAGKFSSSITIDKKSIYLGLHQTAQLAHEAYMSAKKQFHKGYVA